MAKTIISDLVVSCDGAVLELHKNDKLVFSGSIVFDQDQDSEDYLDNILFPEIQENLKLKDVETTVLRNFLVEHKFI